MDLQLNISGSYPSTNSPDGVSSRPLAESNMADGASLRSVKQMKGLFELMLPSSSTSSKSSVKTSGPWCSSRQNPTAIRRSLEDHLAKMPMPTPPPLLDHRTAQEFLSPILSANEVDYSAPSDRDGETLASYYALEGKKPARNPSPSPGAGAAGSLCATSFRDVRICGPVHDDDKVRSHPTRTIQLLVQILIHCK